MTAGFWGPGEGSEPGALALEVGAELLAINGQRSRFHELLEWERLKREVQRVLREEDLELGAGPPLESWAGDEFLGLELPPVRPVVERLAAEGDNVLLAAQYKTGKTTLTLNLVRALVEGTPALGRLEVPRPRRTYVLNMEMAANRYQQWLRELRIGPEALRLVRLANRRGKPLRLSSSAVRARLVDELRRHGTEVWLLDCLRPVASASGLSENSNDDMGLLLSWLDEIKAAAGVGTFFLVHHTGRAAMEEGAERARGATALDDWPDVRMLLTKDGERRFLRTSGRMDEDLPESRLEFDAVSRLLTIAGEGESRAQAKDDELVAAAVRVATESPGIKAGDLAAALAGMGHTSTKDQRAATNSALFRGRIHRHPAPKGKAQHHYAGPCSADCPGVSDHV